jgi:2-dehydropantoate 2-reductase
MLARIIGAAHVVEGVAYIVASLRAPGHVSHVTADRMIFGEADGSRSARLTALAEAGRRAGFEARVSEAIGVEVWTKFVRLSIWSGMTAAARSPMGVIRETPELMALTMAGLDEGIAVGHAHGIDFAPSVREDTQALVRAFPPHSRSSMLEDLEHGRRLELPWLSGAVVELGREAGVPTPVHRFLAAVLTPFVEGSRPGPHTR